MFKKGDIVVCIDDTDANAWLTKWKEYTIQSIESGTTDEEDFVEVIADTGEKGDFWESRFKLKDIYEGKESTKKELIEELFNSIEAESKDVMRKEFIPYEEALALKELGFDDECLGFFTSSGSLRKYADTKKDLSNFDEQSLKNGNIKMGEGWCSAPLHQQAFNFFKEKGYVINVYSNGNDGEEWSFLIKNKTITTSNSVYFPEEKAQHACLRELIYLENLKKGL